MRQRERRERQATGAPDRGAVRRGRGRRSRRPRRRRHDGLVEPAGSKSRPRRRRPSRRTSPRRRPSSTRRRSTRATAPASSTSPSRVASSQGSSGVSPFTPGGSSQQSQAEGTGYVYDKSGNIITADHVVDGATKITVRFKDGSTAKATLVGTDPSTDTAVIKVSVPSSKLTPLDARRQLHRRAGRGRRRDRQPVRLLREHHGRHRQRRRP